MERRNGANGTNGNHVIPVQTMMMPMPSPAPSKEEGGLDTSAIWNAVRRRWFLALGLGLLLGVPAAIGAWMFAPAPYVAFAELRLNSISPSFPGSNSGRIPDFANKKQAVLKRASHPMLLKEALRNPEIQTAGMIREQEPHVIPWLEENLAIKSVGEEYFRIELDGENPKELAAVVNSVSDALIVDVEHDMNKDRTTRQRNLNSLITEVTSSIATKTNELENMRNDLKVDPAEIERRQSYLIELSSSLRSALVTIELERLKYQGQAPALPANGKLPQQQIESLVDAVAVGDPRHQRAFEEVSRQNKRITDQERYVRQQTAQLDDTHPDRVAAERDLAIFQKELENLTSEVKRVREVIKNEVLKDLPVALAASVFFLSEGKFYYARLGIPRTLAAQVRAVLGLDVVRVLSFRTVPLRQDGSA
jgi:hypothetical protein